MEKLEMFKREFEKIKSNSELNKSRKSMLYATLMTQLEREFKIPILNDEDWNKRNFEVLKLYREISMARDI